MSVHQISVFLENRAGQLAEVTQLLAEGGIDLRAISIAETKDYGVLRLIVDDTDKAVEALLAQGVRRFLCMDEDVCTRTMTVLRDNGLSIPGDAQVASFADTDQIRNAQPPVSALSFDSAELARAACREFIHALNDDSYDPKPLLGYKVRLRQSMI
jgi:DNA-binding LacI/PurR family transcriptional regulator